MTASLAPAILRYVPHHEIDRYLQEGWVVTNDLADCYHGEFAVLMARQGDCQDAPPKARA